MRSSKRNTGMDICWIGFDPGRDKCGVAVVRQGIEQGIEQGTVLHHEVVASQAAIALLLTLLDSYTIQGLIIGNQTTSKQWQARLRAELPPDVLIFPVDERNTTLEARDRYWQMYPPQGLQRLLPPGLRQPPRPVDDIVAILLVERYLTFANKPANKPKNDFAP